MAFFVAIVVIEVNCYLGHVKKCNVMLLAYCRLKALAVNGDGHPADVGRALA